MERPLPLILSLLLFTTLLLCPPLEEPLESPLDLVLDSALKTGAASERGLEGRRRGLATLPLVLTAPGAGVASESDLGGTTLERLLVRGRRTLLEDGAAWGALTCTSPDVGRGACSLCRLLLLLLPRPLVVEALEVAVGSAMVELGLDSVEVLA